MKARIWVGLLGSFLLLAPVGAAPLAVSYQGLLTDAGGVPVNGTASFVFQIFAAPSGGTGLWTETQPSVQVVDGVYTVQLGSITALPASLFDGSERYLEVTANGELMSPRQRMTSVPYALSAARVEQPAIPSISALAGLPCDAAHPSASNLSITYGANGAITLSCVALLTVTTITDPTSGAPSPPFVNSNPAGIHCTNIATSDCSESYVPGTAITLNAAYLPTLWTFTGWGGACTGTGACVVTMDANKAVTANFVFKF